MAASLNLITYEEINIKLVLIPINGATINKTEIETALNNIYKQAVAKFTVSDLPNMAINDFLAKKFNDGGSVLISNYNVDMNTVIEKFTQENAAYDQDSYYLFILPGDIESLNKLGYMPLNEMFGFIFAKNQSNESIIHAIAQEIGHGAFGLYHSSTLFGITQGSTSNLMDSNNQTNATSLLKTQWDKIHSIGE